MDIATCNRLDLDVGLATLARLSCGLAGDDRSARITPTERPTMDTGLPVIKHADQHDWGVVVAGCL